MKFNWQKFFDSIKDANGNKVEIPLSGSLGLLSLGDIGVIAWKKRIEAHRTVLRNQIISKKLNSSKDDQ